MSRTRNKYTSEIWYLFEQRIVATNTDGAIDNETATIGKMFQCDRVEKVKAIRDPMTGRVIDNEITEVLKTDSELEFEVNHKVANTPSPNKNDYSTITTAKPIIKSVRGGKHNTKRIEEWALTIS